MQENSSTKGKTPKREGQIIKRGKDTFLVRVFLYKDLQGKRIYYNATIKGLKKDAEDHLTDYLQKRNIGTLKQKPSEQIFAEFAENYLTNISTARRRNREIDIYKLKHYINPYIGHIKLKDISSLHIENFYKELKQRISQITKKPLSGTTRKHLHSILFNIFSYALVRNQIIESPMKGIVSPKTDCKEVNTLSPQQVIKFLETVDNYSNTHSTSLPKRIGAMFHLAIELGLRPEEIYALKWKDLFLENLEEGISATLQVRRVVIRTANKKDWWFDEPKTQRSRRSMSLSDELVKRLIEHRKNVEKWKTEATEWFENDLVFPNIKGEPHYPDSIRKLFKKILEEANINSKLYRLYDLRHTCATLLLRANVHPKIVSERLGHSSISITLDVYSHCVPTMQETATKSISNMIYVIKEDDKLD